MPRATRSAHDIEEVKQQILDAAMSIIVHEGFQGLSMRKLALRVSMTAANIYNYYENKDELYLAIRMRGFELLYGRFKRVYESSEDALERYRGIAETFVEFGTGNPDYYEILFGIHTPKYLDYVGTSIESSALVEKQIALKAFGVFAKVIAEILEADDPESLEEARHVAIERFTAMHGPISLFNSGILHEVDERAEDIVRNITVGITSYFDNGCSNSINSEIP